MVKFPIVIQQGPTKFSDDGSLLITGQGNIYSLNPRKLLSLGRKNYHRIPSFLDKKIFIQFNFITKVYSQMKNFKFLNLFARQYHGDPIKINKFGFILLQNYKNNFAILTIQGKIVRKLINTSKRPISYLKQFSNILFIWCQGYYELQAYDFSKGQFEKQNKITEFVSNIYAIDLISCYENILILDFMNEKMIKIFKDMKLIQEFPYQGKDYTKSDDRKYLTFYLYNSQRIDFFNCNTLQFEDAYCTNESIKYARRLNETKLEINWENSYEMVII